MEGSLHSERGAALIEVLVALLITAIGVMGSAATQLNSVKFNQAAKLRSNAVLLANDIGDRMRANRMAALKGEYDIAVDEAPPSGSGVTDMDVREWLAELGRRLPAGDGAVIRQGTRFVIRIQWSEGRLQKTRQASDTDLQTFDFVTEL